MDVLKCMMTNFESINNKIDEFRARVHECRPDVIFGSETWLKEDTDNVLISLPGFNVFRTDTTEIRGVLIYVNNKYTVVSCPELNGMNVKDTLWFWLKITGKPDILLGVIRRKGDSSNDLNASLLEQFELAVRLCKGHLLVTGDFNLPNIDWCNSYVNDSDMSFSQVFFDKLNDLYLFQHVNEPTRQRGNDTPNCLDLVISSNETDASNINVMCPLGKADHCVVTWDFHIVTERRCGQELYKYDYQRGDYEKLRDLLAQFDWSSVTLACNVESAWECFHNNMMEAVNQCVPRVKITSGDKVNPPWFNLTAKRSVKKKYHAWKRYKETRSYVRYVKYTRIRNKVAKKLRRIKRDYEKNLINKIKSNAKAFYMYVNSKIKSNTAVSKIKNTRGVLTDNNFETAEVLNDFFQSVYVKEDDRDLIYFNDFVHCVFDKEAPEPFNYLGVPSVEFIDDVLFTPEDVKKLLIGVNVNKALGPDEIHPRVLKEAAEVIFLPLYCIMRQSIDQCSLPSIWKTANVTPIFKKGDRVLAENYRPVSLTSQVCKICEKIIRHRIVEFLEKNNLFCDEQHGFRKARSTLTNLLTTLDEWTRLYDEGLPFDVLYLDFRKAFDSVPYARLLYKLRKCGITGKLNGWIEDFLNNRNQAVCINGAKSSYLKVTSGVPQGSVLGPVLFLVFVNDLPASITTKCKIFADDTKIYHPILSLVDFDTVQQDLHSLVEWSNEWLLGFNSQKCKVMHFGRNNPCYEYVMNENTIESVTEDKDLGITVSNDLSFSKYICNAAAKANRVLGLIRKTFSYVSKESFLTLYKTYVRPHLEYCVQVWSPYLKKDIDVLEKVQRRATKIVPELAHLSYEDRLKELKLTTLEDRRIRGDLIEVYKIVNKVDNVDCSQFFEFRDYAGLRGHCQTLQVRRCRYNVRKYYFSNRVVCLWNSLPESVVISTSVNEFKNNYDRYYYGA